MRLVIGFGISALSTAVILWIVFWSPMAKECFAKGGTNIDPLTFGCYRTTRM